MRPVVSLLTLGVADVSVARAFYGALGWRESSASTDDVAFFAGVGTHLAVWSRAELAADSGVDDPGGWGGIVPAHNVGSPEEVDAVLAEAAAAGGTVARGLPDALGRVLGDPRRPRRAPLGGRAQPVLAARRGRQAGPARLRGGDVAGSGKVPGPHPNRGVRSYGVPHVDGCRRSAMGAGRTIST